LLVSALTGQGIPDLRSALGDSAWGGRGPGPEAPLTRARHREHVERAIGCLRRALETLGRGGLPEVAASEIHAARHALAGLLGWGSPDDVLETIFSEFCVGK
jgi:tRNA modification GTPase